MPRRWMYSRHLFEIEEQEKSVAIQKLLTIN